MSHDQTPPGDEQKTTLFSGLSHELKVPIHVILSSLQLLELKLREANPSRFDEEYRKCLSFAQQNCLRLMRLANNLLDTARMEEGSLELCLGWWDVAQLVAHTVEEAAPYGKTYGVQLVAKGTQEQVLLRCDRYKVERILLNLLSNAIKYAGPGEVVVTLCAAPEEITISVSDQGPGIDPEFLPHVFEKYRMGASGLTRSGEGSGLGLYIAKVLTELQGGRVQVESTPGQGSCFAFTLPQKELAGGALPLEDGGSVVSESLDQVRLELASLEQEV